MSAASTSVPNLSSEHEEFLVLLPRIQTHARIAFRNWKCATKREDAVQECVALAWMWYVRLQERGKDVSRFPIAFAVLVVKSVKSGRRLCGKERSKEVRSLNAQWRGGFAVEGLPSSTRRTHEAIYGLVKGRQLDSYEERLKDNSVTPPPDAAAFRIDFPQFLAGLSARDREMAMFLSVGHGTSETANRFDLTPGRVSQLREQWRREW